jgi:hypothetical protein
MYTNFSHYWESKKEILTNFGITEQAAQIIWNDAVDNIGAILVWKLIK